jgi:hypothetical protein
MRGKRPGERRLMPEGTKIMRNSNEISIGTGLMAAVNVAVANTVHVLIHPVHTARNIVGLEKDKSIPQMVKDEEIRIIAKRSQSNS